MSTMNVKNAHLQKMNEDNLYHLGLSTKNVDFKKEFGDVKYIFVGGSAHRIQKFAQDLASEAGIKSELPNLAVKGGRYVMYKVASVLLANHGMGMPSISILLHELIKLVHYAGCRDVNFIRMGTSGGLGVTPGTLVVTTEALNTELKPFYEIRILGKTVKRPADMDEQLTDELYQLAKTLPGNVEVVKGKTVCADDFYEEQARLDGAFCNYTEENKLTYMKQAFDAGARNFEMESLCLGALCKITGHRAAVVCVTLLDRLISDQIVISPEQYARFEQLPTVLLTAYLKKHNALSN